MIMLTRSSARICYAGMLCAAEANTCAAVTPKLIKQNAKLNIKKQIKKLIKK